MTSQARSVFKIWSKSTTIPNSNHKNQISIEDFITIMVKDISLDLYQCHLLSFLSFLSFSDFTLSLGFIDIVHFPLWFKEIQARDLWPSLVTFYFLVPLHCKYKVRLPSKVKRQQEQNVWRQMQSKTFKYGQNSQKVKNAVDKLNILFSL